MDCRVVAACCACRIYAGDIKPDAKSHWVVMMSRRKSDGMTRGWITENKKKYVIICVHDTDGCDNNTDSFFVLFFAVLS